MPMKLRTLRALLLSFSLVYGARISAARDSGDERASVPATQSNALAAKQQAEASATLQNLPLRFELNQGQSDARVKFLSRGSNHTLFLTASEAVLALRDPGKKSPSAKPAFGNKALALLSPSELAPPLYMLMAWVGANLSAQVDGEDELPGKANYLIGDSPSNWRTHVPLYRKVRYRDVYPGVDVVYYGNDGKIEYDLIVSPGADLHKIRLRFPGATKTRISPQGDLVLKLGRDLVILHKPVVYQEETLLPGVPPSKHYIDGRYVAQNAHQFGFQVGFYDPARPLVIDPALTYSTFIGGSNQDAGTHVAVDSSGNAYIVGFSDSPDFPVANPLQSANKGSRSVFLAKINTLAPGASSLVYSTYLGGVGSAMGRGIAVDSTGNVYIVGDTNSKTFPITPGAFQTSCKGTCANNAFVAKIDPFGSSLLYSSYLGGSNFDFGFGIAIDSAGRMYFTGTTSSSDFPTTVGAFQTVYKGGSPGTRHGDSYVAVLNPAGNGPADLVYSTYLGGSGDDFAWGLAIDASNFVYVTGSTLSSNFPITPTAFQSALAGVGNIGMGDGFLVKLNPAGLGANDLLYSTYFGGTNDDRGESVAVDSSGFAYVIGMTTSPNFPSTSTAFHPNFTPGSCNANQCADAIIMKWDPRSSGPGSLLYSTFLGGSGFDLGHGIAVDATGIVYASGETGSNDFPLVNPIQTTCGGGCPNPVPDVFIAKLDLTQSGSAALLFSTYLGGNGTDTGQSIAIDAQGNAYVTGQTYSSNFPTMMPFQPVCKNCSSSSDDGYLARVCITACPSSSVSTPTLAFGDQTLGSTSNPQPVTLSNPGTGTLTIISITAPTGFIQSNSCGVVLSAGSNCAINVTFSPQSAGPFSGALTILTNASPTATQVSLSGAGVAVTLAPSPGNLNYSAQPVATTSASQPVTLSNSGPTAISVSAIQANGDFAQTNNCASSVAANSNCTVNVTFTPAASGSRSGTLTITDSASNSPQTVSLTGTGTAPVIGVSSNALTFSAQVLGSSSASQPVTVSNTGTAAASISSITASGDFAQTNNCGTSLAVSTSCIVNVTFTPAATGTRTGSLSIADNAAGTPQLVSLTGTGANVVLGAAPAALTFTAQQVATTSALQPVTLSNSGPTAISVTSIQANGDYAQTNNCASSVAANSNCTVNVTFTPTASGSRSGTLTITDSAANSPQTVSLTGTGTAPVIGLSSNALTFPAQVLGSGSASQPVTVSNTGTAAASISSISASGDFAQTNNCGASLAVSTSCTVNVTFTPTATGTRTGSLSIADNAANSPQLVSLTGTGANVVLSAAPSALTFTAQAQGSTSASQPVTLSNSGPTAISVSGIQANGDFGQTNNCGTSLAPSTTCTVNITFTPTASGTRSGMLTITDSAANSPQTVSLTGTGVIPTLNLSTTSLYFGTVVVGTTSPALGVTLSNNGPVPVTVSSIQTTGQSSQTNNCGAAIAPGSSCFVSVTFQPTTPGGFPGSLLINDNAANSPQSVSFVGTGTIANVSIGWSLSFGTTPVATSLQQTFTITDVGAVPLTVSSISVSGANPGDFSQTNNCAAAIAPGSSCSVTVTFTPTATGLRRAVLLVNENGGGGTLGIRITGTGN
jgi:hypothetical protein